MSDIHLVSMPFASFRWPSLAIGQLVAAAKNAGMDAKGIHFPVRFAQRIGYNLYELIAEKMTSYILLGEWLFSGAAFDETDLTYDKGFLDEYLEYPPAAERLHRISGRDKSFFRHKFKAVLKVTKPFIEESAQKILAEGPKIVGCSATFQQYNASLALLRHLKHLNPSVITLLGGANCEGVMGWIPLKNFEWIDFVVSGEADTLFPDLCQKIFSHGANIPVEDVPYGVYSKNKFSALQKISGETLENLGETAKESNLNSIPLPDFDGYFEDLEKTGARKIFTPLLIMETSRGCWKGQRKPCNFCGLNGARVHFRAKSPERVLQEFEHLANTHGIKTFMTTDTILNMGYFNNLLKELAHQKAPYTLFFETVSTMNEQQVALLADAGVVWIQPGIESLHDELLKLLNKGNSTIHNIALLKYTLEQGIYVSWNILYNIPGDQDAYYQQMGELIPLLYHLYPPNMLSPIRYDRFSEYYEKSEQFGLRLSPYPSFNAVYPFSQEDLNNFAYFFQDIPPQAKHQKSEKPGIKHLRHQTDEWRTLFGSPKNGDFPQLLLSETENGLCISDTRPCAVASEFILNDRECAIYEKCRQPVTRQKLYSSLLIENPGRWSTTTLEQTIQGLIEKKLLLQMNGRYLALATVTPRKKISEIFQTHRRLFQDISQYSAVVAQSQKNAVWKWFETLELE